MSIKAWDSSPFLCGTARSTSSSHATSAPDRLSCRSQRGLVWELHVRRRFPDLAKNLLRDPSRIRGPGDRTSDDQHVGARRDGGAGRAHASLVILPPTERADSRTN